MNTAFILVDKYKIEFKIYQKESAPSVDTFFLKVRVISQRGSLSAQIAIIMQFFCPVFAIIVHLFCPVFAIMMQDQKSNFQHF